MALYTGDDANNEFLGTEFDDTAYGRGGNDVLGGDSGDDELRGGAGADNVFGGYDEDVLYGSGDTFSWINGWSVPRDDFTPDRLAGEAGEDEFHAHYGDTVIGDQSNPAFAWHDRLWLYLDELPFGIVADFSGIATDILYFGGGTISEIEELRLLLSRFADTVTLLSSDGITGTEVFAGAGDDQITGSAGRDVVDGGDGSDELNGGGGNDRLTDDRDPSSVDRLNGGAGDDVMYFNVGDHADGGDGNDVAVIRYSWDVSAGVTANLSVLARGRSVVLNGGTLVNIERIPSITLTDFADRVTLLGNGGGLSEAFGEGGDDVIRGSAGRDSILGGSGSDILRGGGGADVLEGGNGASDTAVDHLLGEGGNDSIIAGLNDIVDGGSGIDTVSLDLSNAGAGVTIDFSSGTAALGTGSITGVEAVAEAVLSGFDDNLVLPGGNARVYGLNGNDRITGGAGSDVLEGGAGDDWLAGGGGANVLRGGTGSDTYRVSSAYDIVEEISAGGSFNVDTVEAEVETFTLPAFVENLTFVGTGRFVGIGNGWANVLTGGGGNDVLIGGEGADTYVIGDPGDLVIEQPSGNVFDADEVQTTLNRYTLTPHVENLVFTGRGGFIGTGNREDNALTGGTGRDTLNGDAGDDELRGGGNADVLTGGGGQDDFVFASGDTGAIVNHADLITDFRSTQGDRIVLSGFDADSGTAGVQAFTFIDRAAFSGTAGELRWQRTADETWLTGDTDGDGAADMLIRLAGRPVIRAADLMLGGPAAEPLGAPDRLEMAMPAPSGVQMGWMADIGAVMLV
jgi:Ca2+-binding RTX toxin-like protein